MIGVNFYFFKSPEKPSVKKPRGASPTLNPIVTTPSNVSSLWGMELYEQNVQGELEISYEHITHSSKRKNPHYD